MSGPECEALVIGAGPAGSVAAARLAEAGRRVILVERKSFPRAKVCGEFISPAVTGLLERLIPPGRLGEAGARRVDRLVLECGDRARSWALPQPAWSLSRRALDDLLLARAQEAKVQVRQPASVRRVEYGDEHAGVELASGERVRAGVVIHADGSGRHDPAGPVPNAPGLVGLKCHIRPPQPIEGVRMRALAGGYLGSIGIEGGEATIAMTVRTDLLARFGGDRDALVGSVWPGFEPGWRTTEWMACPVARSRSIRGGHPRSMRIGNAAGAVDPIGGEGIGLALWSGDRLAGLLEGTGLGSIDELGAVQRAMHGAHLRRMRTRRPACRLAGEALMRPRLVGALWPLLGLPGLTLRPWYRLTGKPGGAVG